MPPPKASHSFLQFISDWSISFRRRFWLLSSSSEAWIWAVEAEALAADAGETAAEAEAVSSLAEAVDVDGAGDDEETDVEWALDERLVDEAESGDVTDEVQRIIKWKLWDTVGFKLQLYLRLEYFMWMNNLK